MKIVRFILLALELLTIKSGATTPLAKKLRSAVIGFALRENPQLEGKSNKHTPLGQVLRGSVRTN